MKLPFTPEQFLQLLARYNEAIFPFQFAFYLLGFAVFALLFVRSRYSGTLIGLILSCLWLWMAGGYHLAFFTRINSAAYVFAGMFMMQAILFMALATTFHLPAKRYYKESRGVLGIVFVLFGLAGYPLLSNLVGHHYPASPGFGLPCPTTIFTFGVILLTATRRTWLLMVIPLIWSVIGFTAALQLGMKEDATLLASALLSVGVLIASPSINR